MIRIPDYQVHLTWVSPIGSNEWAAHCGPYKLEVCGFTWRLTANGCWISNGAAAKGGDEVMFRAEDYLRNHLKRLLSQLDGADAL